MKKYKRVFVIVLDSLGIGPMADSEKFGDIGVATYQHIHEFRKGINDPYLKKMGIETLCGMDQNAPLGYARKCNEASNGKDTMTGHWEMMGLHITKPFQTFTDEGFPPELIAELEKQCGRKVIGNKASSGTVILDEYGEEELATGNMIVYTSADSVLQICGNEETMGLENLYKYCEIARELTLRDEWKVGRVIARPYIGKKKGEFKRTSNRHDYALKPYGRTAMNILKDHGLDVISVGKIDDIFVSEGVTEAYRSKSSVHGMEQTIEIMDHDFTGLCFVNLVDFDANWGHRRNPQGYGDEIERFDEKLKVVLEKMQDTDLLMITADHGNDPTYKGSDHTREQVPLLIYSPSMEGNGILDEADCFADIGATILDNFELQKEEHMIGNSILELLK